MLHEIMKGGDITISPPRLSLTRIIEQHNTLIILEDRDEQLYTIYNEDHPRGLLVSHKEIEVFIKKTIYALDIAMEYLWNWGNVKFDSYRKEQRWCLFVNDLSN